MPNTSRSIFKARNPLRRVRCRLCNNLEPTGANTTYDAEGSNASFAHLIVAIDAFRLNRVVKGGCRFCVLLCEILDEVAEEWRGERAPIELHIFEKGPITLRIRRQDPDPTAFEIYSPPGMYNKEFTTASSVGSTNGLLVRFSAPMAHTGWGC